jgi:peptidoglycan/LPS O-acetylase OafA/YrhL
MIYLIVISILMLAGQMPSAWACVASAAVMLRNIVPKHTTNWETAHFWSLAVEEHFYLFLPGFPLLCRRYRVAILLTLIVAAVAWRLHEIQPANLPFLSPLIYLRTDMAIGWILMGSVFGLALRKPVFLRMARSFLHPSVALLYIAAVFVRVGLHTSRWDAPLLMTVFPPLIAATVLHPASVLTQFLELAPLRFIGRMSYSLYLWQQLFFNFYVAPAAHSLRSHVWFCWCLVFGCAVASYMLIETPLVRIGHRIAKRYDKERLQRVEAVD